MAKKDNKHSKLTINGRMLIQACLCDDGTEFAAFYGIGGAFLEALGVRKIDKRKVRLAPLI